MNTPDPYVSPKYYAAIDVHGRFHDEYIAFSQARRYINSAGNLARTGHSALAQDHAEFAESLKLRHLSPENYLVAQLFIAHISAFELFLQDLITVVVKKYPQKIGSVQFRLSEVLQASDTEELVYRAAEEILNKLTYKKPGEYLKEVCELLSVEPSLVSETWPKFIEAKARRDLGVHNGWVCNQIYLRKLSESQIASELKLGDLSVPKDFRYLNAVSESLYSLSNTFYEAASVKLKV